MKVRMYNSSSHKMEETELRECDMNDVDAHTREVVRLLMLAPNSLGWAIECAKADENNWEPMFEGDSPENMFKEMVDDWAKTAPKGCRAFCRITGDEEGLEAEQVSVALKTFNGDYVSLRNILRKM